MKLIVYTLNSDGTIPRDINDGGYLPCLNGNTSPQDFDLVGVATDKAEQEGFANEAALLAYAIDKGLEYKTRMTDEIIPLEDVVANVWAKL